MDIFDTITFDPPSAPIAKPDIFDQIAPDAAVRGPNGEDIFDRAYEGMEQDQPLILPAAYEAPTWQKRAGAFTAGLGALAAKTVAPIIPIVTDKLGDLAGLIGGQGATNTVTGLGDDAKRRLEANSDAVLRAVADDQAAKILSGQTQPIPSIPAQGGAGSNFAATAGNAGIGLLNQLATPQGIATLPMMTEAGISSAAGKALAGTFAASQVAQVPAHVQQIQEAQTPATKGQGYGELAASLAFAGLAGSPLASRELPPVARTLESGIEPPVVPEIKTAPIAAEIAQPTTPLGIVSNPGLTKWISENGKRLFTAEGNLPPEVFNRWVDRNGEVKADSREITYATRDLYDGLRKEFNIGKLDEIKGGFDKVPADFVNDMNDVLLGKRDINTLPLNVRPPLQAMRDKVDALSQKMLDDGIVPDRLKALVGSNLGTYLTRSYRVFDDPKWAEQIPITVRNQTRSFILGELQKSDPAATPVQAEAKMQAMLQDWKDQGSGVLMKSGTIGAKDLTSFIARQDIPEVLRDFMGEYKDPVINYARSVTKMANLIGDSHFLNDVKTAGLGKFLFEDGKQPASHSALIAAKESDVMAPLNGLRTTPEIAEAFRTFADSKPIKNEIAKWYLRFNGLAKSGKTVGSVMTQVRNLTGQTYFWLMNGHFDLGHIPDAVRSIGADLGISRDATFRQAYERYLKLGVVDQSGRASELRDMMKDAVLNDQQISRLDTKGNVLTALKKYTVDAAARAYQVSDDFGKIVGFENELARQKAIHPTRPVPELEKMTAERIRLTYPTYSMVPEWVKTTRKIPLLGPFQTFAYEGMRTAFHNLRFTAEDLRSLIPAQRKAGIQRLAGQLAALGGGYALSSMSRGMLGMNAKDEDDARRFMPPWDQNSQIMFTGKSPGKASYLNLSYANPYSYLTDPLSAIAAGIRHEDELLPLIGKAMGEMLRPFTSEDILAGAIVDLMRNSTPTGRRVWNPQDPAEDKARSMLAHVAQAMEPGTVSRLRKRIIPAAMGKKLPYGDDLSLANEIASELTGLKSQHLDYEQALTFKALTFNRNDSDSEAIFRQVALQRGEVSSREISDAYARSNRAKFGVWKELYGDVQSARRRGVRPSVISSALESSGVSRADSTSIIAGKFRPYVPGVSFNNRLTELHRRLPLEVGSETRRTQHLMLSGEFN